jgi:hypothetical protein
MLATLREEDVRADGKEVAGARLVEIAQKALKRGRAAAALGRYAWLMVLSPGRAFVVVAASIGTAFLVLQ